MPTTYTFKTKTAANEATGSKESSHYMNQPMDAARVAIQGIGNGPMTSDATGTPQTSPLTVSNTAVTTLLIPESAVEVNFIAATNTVNVSEADSTVASKYFTIPTGVQVTIDVANCSTLYLKANTGSSTLSFWFTIV